jgi:hypothetical protein
MIDSVMIDLEQLKKTLKIIKNVLHRGVKDYTVG